MTDIAHSPSLEGWATGKADTAMPEISVVVPTYAQASRLDRCLASLKEQSLSAEAYEVMVVDDCSPDDTPAVIAKHAGTRPRFRTIRHETNRGLAGSRHTGAQAASGNIVLFVDGDLVADPRYVETHLRRHRESGSERLAVIGNVQYHEDYIRGSNIAQYLNSRYLGHRVGRQRAGLNFEDLSPKYYGGGIVSLRRDDYFAAGGYNPAMTSYGGEDVEFGARLKQRGVRIVFAERARVSHLDYADVSRVKAKAVEWGRESARVLLMHNPDVFGISWYKYLLPIGALDKSIRSRLIKIALQGFLNKAVRALIEGWCLRTDGYPRCYTPAVYKLAQAAWFLEGTRQMPTGGSAVYSRSGK